MTDRSDRSRGSTPSEIRSRTVTPSDRALDSRATDTNAGRLAAAAWCFSRGLRPSGKAWEIEIGLDVSQAAAAVTFDPKRATRFQIHIHADEWGYRFCHAARESWIRITDIPFIHGRDEHKLLSSTPPLKNLGAFVRDLEARNGVTFQRRHAAIVTTIPDAEDVIRSWLLSL